MIAFTEKKPNQPTSRHFAEESGDQIFCLAGLWLYFSVSKGMRWMTSGAPAEVMFWDAEFPPKLQCAREGVFNSAVGYDEVGLIFNAVC